MGLLSKNITEYTKISGRLPNHNQFTRISGPHPLPKFQLYTVTHQSVYKYLNRVEISKTQWEHQFGVVLWRITMR